MTKTDLTQWLLESDEPWTRYRTLVDLLGRTEEAPEVQAARAGMLAHPQVQEMIAETVTWGDRPFKRHKSSAPWPISACELMMPEWSLASKR